MKKEIKVYAGYYELYITDKEMPHGFTLWGEFDTVLEAEEAVEETGDWLWLDRNLLDESGYNWDNEDYDTHTFDFEELTSELW